MSIIKIGGLYVKAEPKYELTRSRMKKYVCDENVKPDIVIEVSDGFIERKQKEMPHLSLEECEYIWLGSSLFNQLPDHNAFMLHASAIAEGTDGGDAYLFSAPSGTGKSTHTSLWMKAFPYKKLYILNDDKPVIFCDGSYKASGSPFSGSTDLSENRTADLKGICFLMRGEKNEIKKADAKKALPLILEQTVRPRDKENMIKLLDLIDGLLKNVPVYLMRCLPDADAARMAYAFMSGKDPDKA